MTFLLLVKSLADDVREWRGGQRNWYRPGTKKITISDKTIIHLDKIHFPETLESLSICNSNLYSVCSVHFPATLLELGLALNNLRCIKNVPFPQNLTALHLNCNHISSLVGVEFPPSLIRLTLIANDIESLDNVVFPPKLKFLYLDKNMISSLENAKFPPTLEHLLLDHNRLTTLDNANIPSSVVTLTVMGNLVERIYQFMLLHPNITQFWYHPKFVLPSDLAKYVTIGNLPDEDRQRLAQQADNMIRVWKLYEGPSPITRLPPELVRSLKEYL